MSNAEPSTPTPPMESQPGNGTPKPSAAGSGCGIGCLVFLGLAVLVVVMSMIASAANGGSSSYDGNNKYEAISQCEARIEELLKAPSTAKFSSDATGGGTWIVTGTVDSENGFGAMLRANFQCTVKVNSDTATTTVDYLE